MRGQPWNTGLRLLAPPVAVLALLGPAAGAPRPDAAPPVAPSPDPAPSARPAPRQRVVRPAEIVRPAAAVRTPAPVETPAPAPPTRPARHGGQAPGHVRTGHGRGPVPAAKTPRRSPERPVTVRPPAAPALAAVAARAPDWTLAALLALAAAGAAALSGAGTVAVWRRS